MITLAIVLWVFHSTPEDGPMMLEQYWTQACVEMAVWAGALRWLRTGKR